MLQCYQYISSAAPPTVAGQLVFDHAFEVVALVGLGVHSGLLCNSDAHLLKGSVIAYLRPHSCLASLAWVSHLLTLLVHHRSLSEHSSMFLLLCSPCRSAALCYIQVQPSGADLLCWSLSLWRNKRQVPLSTIASRNQVSSRPCCTACSAGQQLCQPSRLSLMRRRGTSQGHRCLESSLGIRTKQVGCPCTGSMLVSQSTCSKRCLEKFSVCFPMACIGSAS